ncbi:MAG: hypothetical protein IPM66_21405 [Acidobacteriota bacterium]|nr:MAG: hypothetical protein IPM66_21405 [Acidobacteriota bacterium]
MNTKLVKLALSLIVLVGAAAAANAQVAPVSPKAVKYSTAPKLVISKLKSGDQDVYDVRGKVTFTVTAANSDDSVAGTLTYTIPDDARQKIASQTGKQVSAVPAEVTQNDAVAYFQKGTAAPVIHLEISPMSIEVAGAKLSFNRVVLDVKGREGGNIAQYTTDEMEALFTVWAKQINNGRARRGIIARMNKVINGEPE